MKKKKRSTRLVGNYLIGFRWYLYHPLSLIMDLFREVKAFFQRGYRGYADCDIWNLNDYLDIVLGNAIRDFSELNNSYPGIKGANTPKEWKKILKKMGKGFDDMRDYSKEVILGDNGTSKWKKVDKGHKESLKLLSKWWNSMWD